MIEEISIFKELYYLLKGKLKNIEYEVVKGDTKKVNGKEVFRIRHLKYDLDNDVVPGALSGYVENPETVLFYIRESFIDEKSVILGFGTRLNNVSLIRSTITSLGCSETTVIDSEVIGSSLDKSNIRGSRIHKSYLKKCNIYFSTIGSCELADMDISESKLISIDVESSGDISNLNLQNEATKGEIGNCPIITFTGIGSHKRKVAAYRLRSGKIIFRAGCFLGTASELLLSSLNLHEDDYFKAHLQYRNVVNHAYDTFSTGTNNFNRFPLYMRALKEKYKETGDVRYLKLYV